jgi:DNA polymerase (family 10)
MPEQLSNRQIADVFHAIADSMEILGEDRFRLQAYRRAGDALADLPQPLAVYRERGELAAIPGVGKAIADKIAELLDTGRLEFYEKLRERVPPAALDMLRIPHLGPRTVARLVNDLGLRSLDELRAAAESGQLAKVKGLGSKTAATILQGIDMVQQREKRVLLSEALRSAENLLESLRQHAPGVRQGSYAGSLRRARATIGDLDLLAVADEPADVVAAFTELPTVARVDSSGAEKATVLLHNGLQADLLVLKPEMWGSALQHFTGGKAHNIRFREMALDRGLSFSEHGFRREDGSMILCATEEQVYAQLGLPWIAPELRENDGEFEAALAGRLPQLVEQGQLRCDLHMHTSASDGRASVREMAEAARALGYSHIAITDHSAYLGITNGLDGARLRAQAQEIAEVNAEYAARSIDFTILTGVEVDITADGSLALADDVLSALDIVVASPHVALNQPAEQATERLVRAMRNPHVDIIGHPTGRLIDSRPGAPIEIDTVARVAAETGTLLEINSGPDRLDLEAPAARRALALGATLTINSDSHHPSNLAWIRLGVLTARRGWAESERVANTWSLERLRGWLAK